jgi:hypothetical protein
MVLDGMMQSAFRKFCGLFGFELVAVLGPAVDDALPDGTASTELDRFIHNGGRIITLLPGQVVDQVTLGTFSTFGCEFMVFRPIQDHICTRRADSPAQLHA